MTPGPGINRTPLPRGFLASGVNSGVRRYRPDLGIITSEVPATAAAVYTLNNCQAACVKYSKALTPSENIMAIITNSGQANAATGDEGVRRNQTLVDETAKALGCNSNQVLIASTGVIGVQMDIEKLVVAIPELVTRVQDAAEGFATAIMTTDLVPKSITTEVTLSQGVVRITGICKGSGMIHPNMATMLGYLLTDVKLPSKKAQAMLKDAVDVSFNMISVDGDSSTNDCVFMLANGASEVGVKTQDDEKLFKEALTNVAIFLAKSIARDGEGATKLIEVNIVHGENMEIARKAARGITLSPLIKSAIHGEDPNWGRILSRLGAEGTGTHALEQMDLKLQGFTVFKDGAPVKFEKDDVRKLLKTDVVRIDIDLKVGKANATAWGCDLSKKYVEINTEYTT